MKLMTLNIDKFNLDVGKQAIWEYIRSINPDLSVLQEYSLRITNPNMNVQIFNPDDIIDKRYTFSGAISASYSISTDFSENMKIIALIPNKATYPYVLGVHLPLKGDIPKLKLDFDIICGDFNVGKKRDGTYPDNLGSKFYNQLIGTNQYYDLWEYAIKHGKAYYMDYTEKHLANQEVFYRTFVAHRMNDFILCKKELAQKLKQIIIDYRTLSFTDHCAIIAEFN